VSKDEPNVSAQRHAIIGMITHVIVGWHFAIFLLTAIF